MAAVSLCSCSGVLFWVSALSTSSSSSSSKGLYGLGSVVSDLLSSLLAFPTSSPSSSSEVLLGVSWLLLGGGGGAGFLLGSACTKAIHGGSLALAVAPPLAEEKEKSRWQRQGGVARHWRETLPLGERKNGAGCLPCRSSFLIQGWPSASPDTVSHFLWANPQASEKHSLPDLPAGPSVLVSEYYSLHLLSSGKG